MNRLGTISIAFAVGMFQLGCDGASETGTAGSAGQPNGGGGAGGTVATSSGGGGTAPVPGSQSISFGPVTLDPGVENTQCIQARLANIEQLRVHQIHNQLSPGSHHMIVYRTADTEEKLTPYDCQPFVDTLDPTKGSPLMVTQKHDELLTLPDNVAFTLQPNQMIRLEVHFINATSEPLEMKATSDFIPIAEADYKYEADFIFLGNPDINIPAMSTHTLGPVFLPLGKLLPDIADKATFFAITGHTHQWGKNVKVSVVKDAADPGTSVYDVPDWSWEEPATVQHQPGFSIPPDGGFKFSCEWDNKSAQSVGFGESANDEMCFFWAYYYPSVGSYVCAHSEQAPQFGTDLCCPGSPVCGFLFN
ncbi:MAG: hypothetical protein IPK82_31945 [Polyangiaceae bacterium]|nr:hypothetical protein [Polyangiaceae bacterium]